MQQIDAINPLGDLKMKLNVITDKSIYNIENSIYIGEVDRLYGPFNSIPHKVNLYRRPEAQYFLALNGGPKTISAQKVKSNVPCVSECHGIVMIDKSFAMNFARSMNLSAEKMIEHGLVINMGNTCKPISTTKEALIRVLALSLTAPSEEKADECIQLAADFSNGMTKKEIAFCKKQALKQVEIWENNPA